MEELEKETTPDRKPRDEPIQRCGHSNQYLHLFGVPRRMQVVNSLNLLEVDLNPIVSDHVTQKFAQAYTKKTLGSVKA